MKPVRETAAVWKGCCLRGKLAAQSGITAAALGVGTSKYGAVATL